MNNLDHVHKQPPLTITMSTGKRGVSVEEGERKEACTHVQGGEESRRDFSSHGHG